MRTWYTYLYQYPDGMIIDGVDVSGIVFYVGKGTGGRFDAHEREAERGCTCRKCREIRRCWESEFVIPKQIAFQTTDEREAYQKELELIRRHSGPYLTNIAGNNSKAPKPRKRAYAYQLILENGDEIDVTDLLQGRRLKEVDFHELTRQAMDRAHRLSPVWQNSQLKPSPSLNALAQEFMQSILERANDARKKDGLMS